LVETPTACLDRVDRREAKHELVANCIRIVCGSTRKHNSRTASNGRDRTLVGKKATAPIVETGRFVTSRGPVLVSARERRGTGPPSPKRKTAL
jgi:hypothetical protein